MLVAGPLTKQQVRGSASAVSATFDCSQPVPPGSKQYFEYLQTRGVTHFKVPLSWTDILPTGLSSQPQQVVVTCYQTLLKQLLEAGLQPLVVLHGSTVPESLRSKYGGWESQELVDKFQQYAEFAFQEFGGLAHTWVTLSDLDNVPHNGQPEDAPSPLQNIIQLNKNLYSLYHEQFPDRADQACDSYYKTDYDLYLLRGLNVNTYQFSISWARIFPSGLRSSQSDKGVQYYDNLINALIESGIDPVVTLYHWDLPQALQNSGGWTNPTIVDAFKDYADFCFSKFGDRVKTWNTFGSPWVVSHAGYGTGEHAPGVKDYVEASYQVTHNIIKSHAEAWHVYNDNYRTTQGGKVGIALNSEWAEPNDPTNTQDVAAADRYLQFMLGWFAHPIFVDGDYSATLKTQIENKKTECATSVPAVLPQFTSEESQRIRGTADFFGLNHYTSRLVNSSNGACTSGPEGVGDFQAQPDPTWPATASPWISSVPWGLRRLLNNISTEYMNITNFPIHISGNGMPIEYSENTLNDSTRIQYMTSYINEVLKGEYL
ncbi:uncharacterized protein V6R79_008599 [Siganus canaliculatus]